VRLSDKEGGVYGSGASIMTDKKVKSGHGSSEKSVSIDEVLQFWRYLAQTKSDADAQVIIRIIKKSPSITLSHVYSFI
jgi:SEL1 protein